MAILWDLCRWSIICHQQLLRRLIVVSEQSAGLSRRFAITCARAQVRRAQPAGLPSLLLALLVIFLIFLLKNWPSLMAKNRRNGMENTPIKLARTFWVFCISYKLIKESNQSLQISAFRIGDRKTEISKFVDFTLFWCLGVTIFEAWASTSPGGWASKSTGAWASKIVIWKIRFFRYNVGSFSTQFSGSTIEILRTPTSELIFPQLSPRGHRSLLSLTGREILLFFDKSDFRFEKFLCLAKNCLMPGFQVFWCLGYKTSWCLGFKISWCLGFKCSWLVQNAKT